MHVPHFCLLLHFVPLQIHAEHCLYTYEIYWCMLLRLAVQTRSEKHGWTESIDGWKSISEVLRNIRFRWWISAHLVAIARNHITALNRSTFANAAIWSIWFWPNILNSFALTWIPVLIREGDQVACILTLISVLQLLISQVVKPHLHRTDWSELNLTALGWPMHGPCDYHTTKNQ